MRRLLWALPCSLALLSPAPAGACLHVGEGESISQKAQQILVVHDDGREDLVIGIDYEAGAAPATVGMVVPVPTVPDAYEALAPEAMDELRDWVDLEMRSHARSRDQGPIAVAAAAPEPAVEELEPARAGPFEIQPLRARGAEAVTALNEWLASHELSTIPEAALRYYVDRGWTFLAVKVSPEEGREALRESASLPPLRISFASERAVIPLKLEAQGAPFEVSVHLVTTRQVADDALEGARRRGFVAAANATQAEHPRSTSYPYTDRHRFHAADLPEPLRPVVERLGDRELFLRVLHARTFGIGAAEPMGWEEELSVPGTAEGERLEGGEPVARAEEAEEPPAGEEPAPEEAPEAEASEEAPAPPATDVAPGGCGCRVAPARSTPLALLGLLGLALLRRRR